MLELSGTNFEKGVFELRFEKPIPSWMRLWTRLGPLNGRLVSLTLFVTAGLLLYHQVPARAFMKWGLTDFYPEAARYQGWIVWSLVGAGLLVYAGVLLLRTPSVVAVFDRSHSQLKWRSQPLFSPLPAKESMVPFSAIESLKVYGPDKSPHTQFGYMQITVPAAVGTPVKDLSFAFLSEEQFKFYPLNLSRITGKLPQGDWKDPEDEPLPS